MKPSVAVGIFEQSVAVLVHLPGFFAVFLLALRKIIPIDEIIAGVVGRVYVPADFDTIEKAFSRAKTTEKGIK